MFESTLFFDSQNAPIVRICPCCGAEIYEEGCKECPVCCVWLDEE